MSQPRLFCFGLGYSAEMLARRCLAAGWRVAGTCRTAARRSELAALGIEGWLLDREQPLADETLDGALAGATHLLSSVPPDDAGDPVLDLCAAAIVRLLPCPAWIGYLSTTSVYGDRGGGWVDETSELRPASERGRRRIAAEAGWLAVGRRHDLPVHVFRLAGIYGPGRSPFDKLRAGRAQRIDKPGQVFGRIHVEDIAAALIASMARPNPGAVYNVCDDEPAAPEAVLAYAAGLLGRDPPPLVPLARADLKPMARSFYAENKRVSNERVKRELGVALAYPDYRRGLKAVLAAEGGR
jgi:nucleoside-diphosphate-sugar epimerase